MALGVFIATALLALVPLEQSQAQLYIDVYQSQDNPNDQTLWIFSGTGTASQLWSVRNSAAGNANNSRRDTWAIVENNGDLYAGTEPSNRHISLSPLLSSTNSKDIASVNARIPGGGRTNITFAASVTNTPTITFASSSRTISHLYMDGTGVGLDFRDDLGVRVSGGSFTYQSGASSSWSGAGLLNKPFSDFETGSTDGIITFSNPGGGGGAIPAFAANSQGSVQLRLHRGTIIPEPEEYALIFGLFALGFVFFHRRMKQKKQPTSG